MPDYSAGLRIAILDMYEGVENQGMRCLREIINQFAEANHLPVTVNEYEVRLRKQVPDLSYDVYISSGGPGSPLESKGSAWEGVYFEWMDSLLNYNADPHNPVKKELFLICHSFQLFCRQYGFAEVNKRRSTAFGVFPIHHLDAGSEEPVFKGLHDPFYVVDSRDYQVVQPGFEKLRTTGAQILALEKARPHVPLERAIMAIRFSENIIGTQFHPEADAIGMSLYLQRPDKKEMVISNHGFEKWESMITHLNDRDKIMFTYSHVLPNFLSNALRITNEASQPA